MIFVEISWWALVQTKSMSRWYSKQYFSKWSNIPEGRRRGFVMCRESSLECPHRAGIWTKAQSFRWYDNATTINLTKHPNQWFWSNLTFGLWLWFISYEITPPTGQLLTFEDGLVHYPKLSCHSLLFLMLPNPRLLTFKIICVTLSPIHIFNLCKSSLCINNMTCLTFVSALISLSYLSSKPLGLELSQTYLRLKMYSKDMSELENCRKLCVWCLTFLPGLYYCGLRCHKSRVSSHPSYLQARGQRYLS